MSLVARHLEANGIPTVICGTARDIVEHCGVARFVFTDFPLGNPCGKPHDAGMQRQVLGLCLGLLESATEPGTTVQSPFTWSEDEGWKERIFTQAQPFMPGAVKDQWMASKERYREAKKSGQM